MPAHLQPSPSELNTSEIRTNGNASFLRRDLLAGHADGATFGAMVGLGETFLPAFALAAGLGEVYAGLVASVPLLAGGVMQTVSPVAVNWLKSHRRWVILCAVAQALTFVPFVYFALTGRVSAGPVLLFASFYWGAGLAAGPAWNTWMATVVPRAVRARFFARRTRLSQAAVLAGFLTAGLTLHIAAEEQDTSLDVFAAIFLLAGACRIASACFLAIQRETISVPVVAERISPRSILRRFQQGSGAPLLLYLVVVQAAVQFSGPYFTPFMFEELHLSYGAYAILIGTSFLAKVCALPIWGHFAHRLGAHRLLWIGGLGITPISGMWLVHDSFTWLLMIQLVGGVVWAAYELAFFLLFFESIPAEERTSVLTVYNLVNTAAFVSGSAAGGVVLYWMGIGRNGYFLLFGLSMAARVVALLALRRVRPISVEAAPIGVRTVGLRPNTASIDGPILPSLPDQTAEPADEEAVLSPV